jgi:hypothetical protein
MKSQFTGLVRQVRASFVDYRTQSLMINELKKRIRRDQPKIFDEVTGLIKRLHLGDHYVIRPILQRYYLQGLYRDQKDIRYFLKAHLDSWPNESLRALINGEKQSIQEKVKHLRHIPSITFPQRDERHVPRISKILGIEDQQTEMDLEPLELEGQLYSEKDQRMNEMLHKVLKLYKIIQSTEFIHSRNLQSPIIIFPLTLFGEDIPECRKRNLIKRKLSYIRQVLKTIPPLEMEDSIYLTNLLDQWYTTRPEGKKALKIRREYKKFIRKTYTIDQRFNVVLNNYAYVKARDLADDIFFQEI